MRAKISKRSVDALQPAPGKDVLMFDTEIAGFAVKITPSGGRTYLLQYEIAGRKRRYRIGRHGELTADEARVRARRLRVRIADGVDPFADRLRDRAIPDVAALGARYMAEHASVHKRPSSAAEDRRNLANHIAPLLGELKTSAVTPEDVARMVRSIAAGETARDEKTGKHGRRIVRGGRGAANRTLALFSKMMSLAEEWGHRPRGSNPCAGVKHFAENKRQRFLSGDELARLGQALAAAELAGLETPAVLAALRLLLFTGCRLAEIRTLRWSYLDLDRAIINLPTSKTGPKTVYLPAPALQVLTGLDRPPPGADAFVFPGRRARPRPGDTGSDTGAARPIEDLRGPWGRIRRAAGMPDLRLHDLRHTFASVGAAGGLSLQLIGGLLGHAAIRTTERYAHLVDAAARSAAERIAADLARAIAAPPRRG